MATHRRKPLKSKGPAVALGPAEGRAPPTVRTVRLLQVALPLSAWPALSAAKVKTSAAEALLRGAAARHLRVEETAIEATRLIRRAIDARRGRVQVQATIDATLPAAAAHLAIDQDLATWPNKARHVVGQFRRPPEGPPPVVVGAGPAGLFAALTLARAGWAPIILERGEPVELRGRKVAALYARGKLDPDSNVCFGEGGAGTYSDGKLYSRIGDPRIEPIMRALVGFGATEDILTHHRPHIGTDKLVKLLRAMRAELIGLGARFHFRTPLTGWQWHKDRIAELVCGEDRVPAAAVVLATGHSARDVWQLVAARGLQLSPRPFAVGLRIEHDQSFVDQARYRSARRREEACLPAADYSVRWQDGAGRAVYSFCMCPGGVVVTTPTEPGHLAINGMSTSARQGRFANSALVVTVQPSDFAALGYEGTFAGADWQRDLERRAFELGGGDFVAPAARAADFLAGRTSQALPATSYRRGLRPAALHRLLPAAMTTALQGALAHFERTWPGFVEAGATLIGVESRTASPVRLIRDKASLLALGTANLYPAGEGLGFGGGIISAAVDGMRAAEALLASAGLPAAEEPVASLAE